MSRCTRCVIAVEYFGLCRLRGCHAGRAPLTDGVLLTLCLQQPTVTGEEAPLLYERINNRWEIAIGISDGQFQQVSFVNAICTTKGGQHVNYIADQVTNVIADLANKKTKKDKGMQIKPFHVKNHLSVFVNCLIENPAFDSQTKDTLTTTKKSFGTTAELPEKLIKQVLSALRLWPPRNECACWPVLVYAHLPRLPCVYLQIAKSGLLDRVLMWAKFKESTQLSKKGGSKKAVILGHPKLDDANFAGGSQADKCTLILTEGDSAKALAVSGLSVVGRDYFGVFPLKGKLLNVRDCNQSQMMANAVRGCLGRLLGGRRAVARPKSL